MPTILLLRHAQASFGAADYDVLSTRGHEQVAALVAALEHRGTRITRVLSGSLRRQIDTAQPVAKSAGVTVETDPRWDEYDSSDVLSHYSTSPARQERRPGSATPAISSRDFQGIMESALVGWIEAGGSSHAAESWDAFSARALHACQDLASELSAGDIAVACTSGGVIAAVATALLAVPARTFIAFNRVSVNSGLTTLAHGRSGTTLVSFNEHAHLQHPGASLVTLR